MTIYLDDYKVFDNKQELNYNVSQHEKAHSSQLLANSRTILRFIARYSVKYAGASHLKVATIAEGTGLSSRTVGRQLKRLESLGIIRRISRTRPKTGGTGANIMQILPYRSERLSEREIDEKSRQQSHGADNGGSEPLHKRSLNNYVLDTAADRNNIPEVLYNALSPFYRGADLRKYVGIVFRAKTRKLRLEAHSDAFTACIADCIRRYKRGDIRSLDAYLYASVRRLSRRLFIGVSPVV